MHYIQRKVKSFLAYKPLYGEDLMEYRIGLIKNTLTRNAYKSFLYNWKKKEYPVGETKPFDEVRTDVEKELFSCVSDRDVDRKKTYRHINCIQHSKKSQDLLANKTFAKSMAYMYSATGDEKYLTALTDVIHYIVSKKTETGIYRCEQPIGLGQDEGPVTAGVIQILCEAYIFTKDSFYLNEAISTADASINHLKSPEFGYIHTLGKNLETTNINSSFAHSFSMMYAITGNEKWKQECQACLARIHKMQCEDGMFSYSTVNRTVFISLYHFMVINALVAVQRNGIDVTDFDRIVSKAAEFGKTMINEDGCISEPSRQSVYSDFHSTTRAALMYLLLGDRETFERLSSSFGLFFNGSKARLMMMDNKRITDGEWWYRRNRQLIDAFCDLAQINFELHGKRV